MSLKKNIRSFLNRVTGRKPIRKPVPPAGSIKKILVISLYFKGDLLFHTAFIQGLNKLYPNADIDLWVKSRTEDIVHNDTRINNILVFDDIKTSGYNETSILNIKGKISFLKALRKQRYDVIIDLTGKYSTALFTLLAKPGYSAGINYNFFGFCYDKFIDLRTYNTKGHLIDKYISVIQKAFDIGGGEYAEFRKGIDTRAYIQVPGEVKARVDKIITGLNKPPDSPLIIIHLTSGWAAKELSPRVFAEIADHFLSKNYFILFIGDEKDKSRLNEVSSFIKDSTADINKLFINLKFMESAELISRADLFIGSDSAPLHLAGASGTPSIGIFGPTNPGFSNPVGEKHKLVYHHLHCSASEDMQYCTRNAGFSCPTIDCMKMIKAGEIITLAEELLLQNKKISSV